MCTVYRAHGRIFDSAHSEEIYAAKLRIEAPVQIVLTPGLHPGPSIYAGLDLYQIISKYLIFAADALAYDSYCIRLMLLGITASEKYLMPSG